MTTFIGLDVHASSSTMAVIDAQGKRLRCEVVETSEAALAAALKTLPRPTVVCMEEGTQSAWLFRALAPLVDEMAVIARQERRQGQKNDERDAFALAQQRRVGNIRRVYKDVGPYGALKAMVHAHAKIVRDLVRAKNRIKALFRAHGIATPGEKVYGPTREEYVQALPTTMRSAAQLLGAAHDALAALRTQAEKELVKEAKRHAACRLLQTAPGIGWIRSAHIVAVVLNPYRFRTKRPFWAYSGLGVVMQTTSDWVKEGATWQRASVQRTRGLNRNHNHLLKAALKGAAKKAIHLPGPLRDQYERLLAAGTKPNLAVLTVARKLAATLLSMWKREEVYDPKR